MGLYNLVLGFQSTPLLNNETKPFGLVFMEVYFALYHKFLAHPQTD